MSTRVLDVYQAQDGFRWRLLSAGRIVAESGEAYTRNRDAVRAARRVFGTAYSVVMQYTHGNQLMQERIR